ncbi:MAG: SPFH domain-containing protein [Christensenella sp.]|uniref:flotillin family protein n=1 Tax=Christensenella sp. TaxID=1935934 RepID=UPI002B2083C6|nr:SPFH domain-containing protein [Christensenella sp.]MEA5004613.1 SPFH domain-containing protein [Christensenella sp.]
MSIESLILIVVIVILVFMCLLIFLTRYKKCPSDKIMVIYGKVGQNSDGTNRTSRCIHGGASFIWPVIQAYQYLDLTPLSIQVDLKSALSRQNIRIDVPSIFTVGISTEQGIMQNAAERLLGLQMSEIQELAKDIIFGQLRLVIATMDIEEINTDRDKFLEAVSRNVESELKKIGLRLINVNVTDISDESGYIMALGKEAAAKAINDAKKSVAEKVRDGSIGEANAQRDQRVEVATADSKAITGENTAKIEIAQSDAARREKEAEATRLATAAEKVQAAKALEEAYAAEKLAELARSSREKATLEADVIVKAEIRKRQIELEAEAEAERLRRQAAGEADAIYAKMEAEARGMQEILKKQASGFADIVDAAGGNAKNALMLMLADKMEDLMKVQVEAVRDLKIDKVTVWDGGAAGKDGKSSTANFLSGLMKSIPPMNEIFEMAGMELPEFLGKKISDTQDAETVDVSSKKPTVVVEAPTEAMPAQVDNQNPAAQ